MEIGAVPAAVDQKKIKAGAEKLSEEKMKLAAMQAKLQALEQEKAMLIAAGQIPNIARASVDLPEALGPIIPTASPAACGGG